VPEVLQAVTCHAARALGASDRHGALSVGRQADFVAWDVSTLAELPYWIGRPLAARVVHAGRTVGRTGLVPDAAGTSHDESRSVLR
jgi:imidazolonepropionase